MRTLLIIYGILVIFTIITAIIWIMYFIDIYFLFQYTSYNNPLLFLGILFMIIEGILEVITMFIKRRY